MSCIRAILHEIAEIPTAWLSSGIHADPGGTEYNNVARFFAGGDLNAWFPSVPAESWIPMLQSRYCNGELAGPWFTHGGSRIDHIFFPVAAPVNLGHTNTCATDGPWVNHWISKHAFSIDAFTRDVMLDPYYEAANFDKLQCQSVVGSPEMKDRYRRLEPSNHPTHVVTLEYVP